MNVGSTDEFCRKRDLRTIDCAWSVSNITAARSFVVATSMSTGSLGEATDERHVALER